MQHLITQVSEKDIQLIDKNTYIEDCKFKINDLESMIKTKSELITNLELEHKKS